MVQGESIEVQESVSSEGHRLKGLFHQDVNKKDEKNQGWPVRTKRGDEKTIIMFEQEV